MLMEKSYAVFGKEKTNDMVVVGEHKIKNAFASLYQNGIRVDVQSSDLLGLFLNLALLRRTHALAVFTIYLDDVKLIKKSIKKLDATHVRFWSNKDGVTITIFDCRDFNTDRRIGRKNSLRVDYLEVETVGVDDFTFTVNAESLKKISNGDWNLRIGQNGVTEITPFGESYSFLIRNQKLMEPVTNFDSVSVGQKISFQFHPNSD